MTFLRVVHHDDDALRPLIDSVQDSATACKTLLESPLTNITPAQIESINRSVNDSFEAAIACRGDTLSLSNQPDSNPGPVASPFKPPPRPPDEVLSTNQCPLEPTNPVDLYRSQDCDGWDADGDLSAILATQDILRRQRRHPAGGYRSWYDWFRLTGFRDALQAFVCTLEKQQMPQLSQNFELGVLLDPSLEALRLRLLDQCAEVAALYAPCRPQIYRSINEFPYVLDTSAVAAFGSLGFVRKYTHQPTGETVAIKTFDNVISEIQRKTIHGEMRLLQLCSHTNIVAFIEAFERQEECSIHMVMSPWAPYTLMDFISKSDMTRKMACPWFDVGSSTSDACIYRIMLQLSDAVDYLHGLPIKHKDIKPQNILLYGHDSESITPLITDVGVRKIFKEGGFTNFTKSTYQYLAPEQIQKVNSGLEADIWQLGCSLALLAVTAKGGSSAMRRLWHSFDKDKGSCQVATEHKDFIATMEAICVPGTPAQESVCQIVTRMLDLDPTKRLTAQEVVTAFQLLH